MRKCRLYATCAMMLLASAVSAQHAPSSDAEVQFKAAQQRELVDGDLAGAIAQYKTVAARAGANRALAAKALLRMAECYRKQGDAEARRVYERVVREYPEQRDVVALARARLGAAIRPPVDGGVVLRKVWTGDLLGRISNDGRLLSFIDWTSGNLMLHDFATGTDRALTGNPIGAWPASNEFAEESVISRDGSRVVYAWYDPKADRYALRVIGTQPNGGASRRLFDSEDVRWVGPYDWSSDGKWIAVTVQRKDRTAQIGVVSTADGSYRALKSMDWRGPTRMFFSPDDRFLAYDLPVADTSASRDVYVLAVDGSREVAAVAHPSDDALMGWSPDGGHLLFASDRSGSLGLWAVRFADGAVRGAPALLKPNIESNWSMGVTRDGALYLGTSVGNVDVAIASVDLATGKVLAPPVQPIQRFVGSNSRPKWSPDGKQLVYISMHQPTPLNRGQVLGVWSSETGTVRELAPALPYIASAVWSPDGRSLALGGQDAKGRAGVFITDAQTGAVTPLVLSPVGFVGVFPEWSPDGRKIYYRMPGERPTETVFVDRDIATSREREIARGPFGRISVSPDGKWIATVSTDSATRASSLLLVPVDGGETRTVFRVAAPQSLDVPTVAWTRDGRALIVNKALAADRETSELWVVPIVGEPRRLELPGTRRMGGISVHPDGRRLAFTTGATVKRTTEVWVLENFLPALKAKP